MKPVAATALLVVGLAVMILPLALTRSLPDMGEVRGQAVRHAAQDRIKFCEELLKSIPEAGRGRLDILHSWPLLLARPGKRGDNLRYLDLTGVKLDGLDLSGADLRFTLLDDVSFEKTDFSAADLRCAEFALARGSGASLRDAKLSGALLAGTNLSDASLFLAQLDHANLSNAILKSADLSQANLTGAQLVATDLDKAILSDVDLRWADYRPLGAPRAAQRLKHLLEVYPATGDFSGLSALRKALVDAGDPSQARRVTYVIESWRDRYRFDAAAHWWHGFALRALVCVRSLAFDLTVDYGVSPVRALALLAASIPAFAMLYVLLILFGSTERKNGLFEVVPKGVVEVEGLQVGETAAPRLRRVAALEWDKVAGPALWFSVLSAFRFGYGTFTLSSWFAVMQPREFEYRAVGALRTLGGLQSLISLYLLVLFAATLFGDIFAGWS